MSINKSNSTTTMKAIFALFLLPLQLFSQDLSGIWVGTIATSQTQMPFELAINRDMTGYSMISFMYKGAEKIAVKKIELIRKDSTFTISDDKLIYDNFTTKHRNIKSYCELSIKMVDSTMVLSGPFHTRTRDLRAGDEDLATGSITVQKQNNKAQTKLIGKLDSLKLSNTLVFSKPDAVIKENPVVAVPVKEAPAVAQNPVPAVAEEPIPAVAQKPVPAATEKPLPAVAEKPIPAVAQRPVPPLPEKPAVAQNPVPPVAEKPAVAQRPVPPVAEKPAVVPKLAPPIPAEQKIVAAAADLASRKIEVIRTIDFSSDSLTLVLFDNGIVDGDTVSVVLNGEVIIPRLGLTDQVYRKVIKIPPGSGDSLQMVIYAENLGTIPPNSGMLIIYDGSDRHEVGFEGDLKKSAAVRLKRKRS